MSRFIKCAGFAVLALWYFTFFVIVFILAAVTMERDAI